MRRIAVSLALAGLLIAAIASPAGAVTRQGPPYDSSGGTADRYTGIIAASPATNGWVQVHRGSGSTLEAEIVGVGLINVEICLRRHGQEGCAPATGAGLHTFAFGPLSDTSAGNVRVTARPSGPGGSGVFQVLRISAK